MAGLALAEALAGVTAAETRDEVIAAALEVAADRYGARAGFVCLPAGPGGVEVVGWRGLDRDRLGAASRHPGFTRLVSGVRRGRRGPHRPDRRPAHRRRRVRHLSSPRPEGAGGPRAPRARGARLRRSPGPGGPPGVPVRRPAHGPFGRGRRGGRHPADRLRPYAGRPRPGGRRRRPLHGHQRRRRRALRPVGLVRDRPARPRSSGPPGAGGPAPRRRAGAPRRGPRGGPRATDPEPLRAGGADPGRWRPRS